MCLDYVTNVYNPPRRRERKAWKVFYRLPRGKVLRWPFFNVKGQDSGWHWREKSSVVTRGKWLKATETEHPTCVSTVRYKTGFHVYETKKDAERAIGPLFNESVAVVVPVRVRNVAYAGTQNGVKVLVAQELFVPEE